jgi:hypothetical protein
MTILPVVPQLVLLHRYTQSQFMTVNVPNNLQLVGIIQPRRRRQEVSRNRLKYLSPPQVLLPQRIYLTSEENVNTGLTVLLEWVNMRCQISEHTCIIQETSMVDCIPM